MSESKIISLRVDLDDAQVPEKFAWRVDELQEEWIEAKAFMLSVYESGSGDVMKMDLWAKEFFIEDMNRLVYFSLQSICDAYFRATSNAELSNEFRSFVEHFGRRTGLAEPPNG
ncbi:MAG: hypothetical protein JPMHGGIA_00070 [Saprospiraceae bacterium]|jgi:gliding motility-associated protein GldC|nr:hypothetical protein [Saprospiraceae bacterium]